MNKKYYVYSITNTENGMTYYGVSENFHKRVYYHKSYLNNNKHDNKILQSDWNKYGEKCFCFKIEEFVYGRKNSIDCENKYIIENNSIYPNGYNLRGNYGNYSNYLKEKMSIAISGNKNPMFGKSNAFMLGKHHSEKTKKMLSELAIGNTYPLGIKSKKNTSSKYVGVTYIKSSQKWQSRISHLGKRIHLGYFETEELAAKAYDIMAIELYGDSAKLNFPLDK